MSFSQLPAVEKDTEKWAAGKFLGPSYFEATLVSTYGMLHSKLSWLSQKSDRKPSNYTYDVLRCLIRMRNEGLCTESIKAI